MADPRTPAGSGLDTNAPTDGETLARAFAGGTEALRLQADAINAINVFPVPDGDTGTNMHLTMRAALEAVSDASARDAASVMQAAAHGALMGAKGNSGVILSQILSGFAAGIAGGMLDAASLAAGLQHARDAAYRSVTAPKEGTILTAITEAARGAAEVAVNSASTIEALLAATAACEEAVVRTPELLPVLKEAGVVDSGAQGLFVLFEGMLRALRGEAVAEHRGGFGAIDPSWLAATRRVHEQADARSGSCTEFVVSGQALDPQPVREHLAAMGNSLLVVGGGDLLHVHLHTHTPDDVLAYGRTLGDVVHEKVEDMEAQFRRLAATAPPAPPVDGLAVVAVGAGEGIEDLLRSLGATVVRGGQTMNPSAGEIRAAIERTGASDVIVLPNNKNIVMAARQAGEGIAQRVRVVETQSVPQGVAALVALNTELPLEDNTAAMREAAEALRHAEITLAARVTTLNGLQIRKGQPIGIVDGELTVASDTVAEAVLSAVRQMTEGRNASLVTLYRGEGEDEAAADAIAAELRAEFDVEIDIVSGGQPHYPYLIGVE